MAESTYEPPVSQLLTYGERKVHQSSDALAEQLGLTAEHIPALIQMATDMDLIFAESDAVEVWAPIHAWQALGQLRAEAAIAPLLNLFDPLEDYDWFNEEIPHVFAMIGAAAIHSVKEFLANPSHLLFSRITAAHCLAQIGQTHPDHRSDCVAALTDQLERYTKTSPELNGFLVSYLLDLNATEAAPTMERAFAAKRVDESIAGDWLDVQLALGLKTRTEIYALRRTVDAEMLVAKAKKIPAASNKGFGAVSKSAKKDKKKGK